MTTRARVASGDGISSIVDIVLTVRAYVDRLLAPGNIKRVVVQVDTAQSSATCGGLTSFTDLGSLMRTWAVVAGRALGATGGISKTEVAGGTLGNGCVKST